MPTTANRLARTNGEIHPGTRVITTLNDGTAGKPYLDETGPLADLRILIDAAHRSRNTPILFGDSGIGKTAFIEELAKRPGCAGMSKIMLNTMERTDLLGMPDRSIMSDAANVTEYCDPKWAWHANNTPADQYYLVFLDELTTAEYDMMNAVLNPLQSRELSSGTKFNDNVYFIAAANPPDIIDSVNPLVVPLANRLMHLNFPLETQTWLKGFLCNWGKPVSTMEGYVRGQVYRFLTAYPNLLQQDPKEQGSESRSGAWPSCRSWDNAVRTAAQLPQDSYSRLYSTVFESFVGKAAKSQLTVFINENLRLPSPEEIINNPAGCGVDWDDPVLIHVALNMILPLAQDAGSVKKITDTFAHIVQTTAYRDVPTLMMNKLMDICVEKNLPIDVDPEIYGEEFLSLV